MPSVLYNERNHRDKPGERDPRVAGREVILDHRTLVGHDLAGKNKPLQYVKISLGPEDQRCRSGIVHLDPRILNNKVESRQQKDSSQHAA